MFAERDIHMDICIKIRARIMDVHGFMQAELNHVSWQAKWEKICEYRLIPVWSHNANHYFIKYLLLESNSIFLTQHKLVKQIRTFLNAVIYNWLLVF